MATNVTREAWAQIRYDYEHTERPIHEICAEHGISSGTLRDRMRRWGWTRRRLAIPSEGPPPVDVAPALPIVRAPNAAPTLHEGSPHPAASHALGVDPPPAGEGEGVAEHGVAGAHAVAAALPIAAREGADAPTDSKAIVARLQGATARVLPAIEATLAQIATGVTHPREVERAGRALAALTRTLRELNSLMGQHQAAATEEEEDNRSIEEFRAELMRRMNAIVAARTAKAESAGDGDA